MESTPLRDAVLQTQLDLTLSGIRYTRYRHFSFDIDAKSPNSLLLTPTPLQRRIQPKILPAIPAKYRQSPHNNNNIITSKTPLPKRSLSPTHRSTLERNYDVLRKSGSLSDLPNGPVSPIERPNKLFNEYSVGQPVMKVPLTPHYHTRATEANKYKTLEPTHKAQRGTFQSSPKGSITPFTTRRTAPSNLEAQRIRVTREILETEETYVQSLRTLTSFFYRPLQKGKLLAPDELKQLFPPQLNSLLSCHTELLDKLRERLANPKFRGVIGDLFADLCPGSMTMDFFQMYSGYVQAFPTALSVYDRHTRTNKEFRGFIRACMESPSCRGLDLCAFLLTPIQRLPRYLLLLNELIKYTESKHPDLYFASLASDNFKACLVLLNESLHHVLHVASISTAWRCESRTKYSTRSAKNRRHSQKVSKSRIGSSISNSDLESNGSSVYVESCPPSIFPAKSKLPVPPTRALEVPTVEDKPPFSPPALVSNKSHTDSGIYEDDLAPDEIMPQLTIVEASNSTRITSNHVTPVEIGNISTIEASGDKKHTRRKSADRISRLFRIFRIK